MEKNKKAARACKADVKKNVETMVAKVEGYTKEDRDNKRDEVKAAFAKEEKEKK